jgi:hypothetical protein
VSGWLAAGTSTSSQPILFEKLGGFLTLPWLGWSLMEPQFSKLEETSAGKSVLYEVRLRHNKDIFHLL